MKNHVADLEPEGLATDGQGWQQRKSIQTRIAILEAAIDCLERVGYARSTTQMISQAAEISRGAMLHHYATKQELIAAVIDYTFYKRMERFTARINALSDVQRVRENVGIELYWESVLSREFAAYLELSVAARTDQELREVFLPKAQQFSEVEREKVLAVFPEWGDKPDLFDLCMDFCIAAMEGLLLNRDVWNDKPRRVRFRALISQTIMALRDGSMEPPPLKR